MDDDNDKIIIIRRRSEGEEEHHGGVWKLAFADFMTAMMAFFLVMWLINSTSKETKATIVQYFNPVQLVDSSPNRKGLRDPAEGGEGSSTQQSATESKSENSNQQSAKADAQAAELHKEPIKALDEIAKQDAPASESGGTSGAASEMLADPFDRMERGMLSPPQSQEKQTELKKTEGASGSKKIEKEARLTEAELNKVIEAALKKDGAAGGPTFEVKRTAEGIMIDLTDNAQFSMFDVGSIKPTPQLVRMLAEIAPIIAKSKNAVEISGHTDARSYKSNSYDNWRLSTDRANLIYYMLVRGGVPETQVTKISGYADRKLKDAKAPLSAVNRRIEIFLRGDGR